MRQGRCYEAVRQTCEALMLAEMCMDRVSGGGVKCIRRREGIAKVELTQDKQRRVRIGSMSG